MILDERIERGNDNNKSVIDWEISFFLENNKDKLSINRYESVIDYLNTKKIILGGDNLITRKQAYRRSHRIRKIGDNDNITNTNAIYAYCLMPYISGDRSSNVNIKRAVCFGYNDNPFAFFSTLKKLYEKEFNIEDGNAVEQSIIKTKAYWEMFGEYETFLDIFCLNSLNELQNIDMYHPFFEISTFYEDKWEDYCEILNSFYESRMKEMNNRE